MNRKIVYATSNPGKIIEISRHFGFHGLQVNSLADFSSAVLDPEENGVTLGENADIKALAYAGELAKIAGSVGHGFCVISDDTGVFIEGLDGEPGIKVRRWKGYKMTDEEIISYTLERMSGLTAGNRNATFRTVLSLVIVDESGKINELKRFEGALKGRILESADPRAIAGFPFESLFFADEYDLLLGDLHRLSDEEKQKGLFNHRERAIESAIPVIKSFIN